ncbi:MAG: hypothetical protein R2717_05055 [Schumannella sp.]
MSARSVAAARAIFVRTSDAESSRASPEFSTTSMRNPVCPERMMFSGTVTRIQSPLEVNPTWAVSAVPPAR